MSSERFNVGTFELTDRSQHVFLSVSEGFEHGPGIRRDGINLPRMLDPHSVPHIRDQLNLGDPETPGMESTTNRYAQRAGTWTIYHHLENFIDRTRGAWEITAVQSNGDLTMNSWHVAYVGSSQLYSGRRTVCGLLTREDDAVEPIQWRRYRCLVKWLPEAAAVRGTPYEFLDVRIQYGSPGDPYVLKLDRESGDDAGSSLEGLAGYDRLTRDIGNLVDFALAGKPIVQRGVELPLANAVDRFDDVRHVFNTPRVKTKSGSQVQLGEYQLFRDINTRRAALMLPVVIDLKFAGIEIEWPSVREELCRERHFKEVQESPTRPGQFRLYPGDLNRPQVEIFLHHNVYPFGAIGVRPSGKENEPREVVSLSCGGFSSRVGTTLQAISRMMLDTFGCSDAMIIDEGLDVCQIVSDGDGGNDVLLRKVLAFTRKTLEKEQNDSLTLPDRPTYPGRGEGMKHYPLNERLVAEVDAAGSDIKTYSDVFRVEPGRSQIRSMLIFARPARKAEE